MSASLSVTNYHLKGIVFSPCLSHQVTQIVENLFSSVQSLYCERTCPRIHSFNQFTILLSSQNTFLYHNRKTTLYKHTGKHYFTNQPGKIISKFLILPEHFITKQRTNAQHTQFWRKTRKDNRICVQAKHAASDFPAFVKTLLGIGILLLALEEFHIRQMAPRPYVLRRGHQHRRRRDWLSWWVHMTRHLWDALQIGEINTNVNHKPGGLY